MTAQHSEVNVEWGNLKGSEVNGKRNYKNY